MNYLERKLLERDMEQARYATFAKYKADFPLPWYLRLLGAERHIETAYFSGWVDGGVDEIDRQDRTMGEKS